MVALQNKCGQCDFCTAKRRRILFSTREICFYSEHVWYYMRRTSICFLLIFSIQIAPALCHLTLLQPLDSQMVNRNALFLVEEMLNVFFGFMIFPNVVGPTKQTEYISLLLQNCHLLGLQPRNRIELVFDIIRFSQGDPQIPTKKNICRFT